MSIVLLAVLALLLGSFVSWQRGRVQLAGILGALALALITWLALGTNLNSEAESGTRQTDIQSKP